LFKSSQVRFILPVSPAVIPTLASHPYSPPFLFSVSLPFRTPLLIETPHIIPLTMAKQSPICSADCWSLRRPPPNHPYTVKRNVLFSTPKFSQLAGVPSFMISVHPPHLSPVILPFFRLRPACDVLFFFSLSSPLRFSPLSSLPRHPQEGIKVVSSSVASMEFFFSSHHSPVFPLANQKLFFPPPPFANPFFFFRLI